MIRRSVQAFSRPPSLPFRSWSVLASLVSLALMATHCGSASDVEPCVGSACTGPTDDAGTATDGGNTPVPPTCDLNKPLRESPDCVDDAVGVFVAPFGDDASAGTKTSPVRSLAKAAELAASKSKRRVYICAGVYKDSVDLKQPTSFFGGFSCAGQVWRLEGGGVTWNAQTADFALRIVGVSDRVQVDDISIVAKDAETASQSSVGILVADSAELLLSNAQITAGRGSNGETKLAKPARPFAPMGSAAVNPLGGMGATNVCADGNSIGGSGATIGVMDATAGLPALGGGAPGTNSTQCGLGGQGQTGLPGTAGEAASANSILGTLSREGWKPAAGNAGKPGTRGQGGGGGGSRQGAGGGGAAGGCGGEGGEPGAGGGASVALAAFSTKVTVKGSKLRAGVAGNGGGGAGGQPGQPASGGGLGGTSANLDGCPGGDSGPGGAGGGGGGGAGGVAVAILYKGAAPTVSESELTKGSAGARGIGGDLTSPADGPEGQALETLALP